MRTPHTWTSASSALASAALVPVTLFLAGCARQTAPPPVPAKPAGAVITLNVPLGLPPLPVPGNNPLTRETMALGNKLYFSTALSKDGSISCASCHNPSLGFSDGQPVSTGVGGKKGGRNAPTVINAAYNSLQFWDGRAANLEAQASGPILNPVEMAHTAEGVVAKLSGDPEWKPLFAAAYGSPEVTMDRIAAAIAAFERTVLRGNSKFDRYQYGGDRNALSAAALRGLEIFKDKAKGNCAVCHTIEEKYALFTDNLFHNLGVGLNAEGELTDSGRHQVTEREGDQGAFRTPTLRNITETAPYMHDGSLKTLKEVIDFYVGGGNANPHRDKEIKSLSHLTQRDRTDLVAFLESLTGEGPHKEQK
ncbi:MAG: c-type cytochrome [Acidobacteria bacterium]|nr:c-type cytochrome [Acidobacteriota bacterium]